MSEASVDIRQGIFAPAAMVSAYVGDFRNAKDWMAGVESIKPLEEDSYRLKLESPVGNLEPEARIVERAPGRIRWVYTSTVEGGGLVEVSADGESACVVRYVGNFRLKGRILSRAARVIGIERFARRMGERSLDHLKHLMEARRHG